jgi:hypothetical protein
MVQDFTGCSSAHTYQNADQNGCSLPDTFANTNLKNEPFLESSVLTIEQEDVVG